MILKKLRKMFKKDKKEEKFENFAIIMIVVTVVIIIFNQMQINFLMNSLTTLYSLDPTNKIFLKSSSVNLQNANVDQITNTAMAIATVFPELQGASSQEEVMQIMFPTGTPEYSEKLGGITFDDPINSLSYLAKWYYSLNQEVKQNDPEIWQRYLNLAAAPRGISCEFCCGVGPQGITADGKSRCGCQHNPALLAVTLGLMKYTDYTDAQILREVMKWKTLFFPKNMIALGMKVAGGDASSLASLPGMVGGC